MSSIMERLRLKMFRPQLWRKLLQAPRFVKPRLEVLEDRLVLDAMLFVGVGTAIAPAAWGVAANWADLSGGAAHVPTASDDVGIPGAAGFVTLAPGENAEVNSIVTGAGSTLIVPGGPYAELKIDSNPPANPPPTFPPSPNGTNFFGGAVSDAGLINANTTNPFTGTQITFAGGATIGPGDLNGNLSAGPNSTITFAGGGGAVNTFAAGATIGAGSGTIIVAAPVTVMGSLYDNTVPFSIVAGGTLGGPGSFDDWTTINWTGGTIS